LRLAHDFSPAQLEAACERALRQGLELPRRAHADSDTDLAAASPALDLAHENVRGPVFRINSKESLC